MYMYIYIYAHISGYLEFQHQLGLTRNIVLTQLVEGLLPLPYYFHPV